MNKEYKTRRGALLAQLEHRCVEPGVWVVEGRDVQKRWGSFGIGRGGWYVEGAAADGHCWFYSFDDALEYIAERTA